MQFDGFDHLSFSDAPVVAPLASGASGGCSLPRDIAVQRAYLRAFLDSLRARACLQAARRALGTLASGQLPLSRALLSLTAARRLNGWARSQAGTSRPTRRRAGTGAIRAHRETLERLPRLRDARGRQRVRGNGNEVGVAVRTADDVEQDRCDGGVAKGAQPFDGIAHRLRGRGGWEPPERDREHGRGILAKQREQGLPRRRVLDPVRPLCGLLDRIVLADGAREHSDRVDVGRDRQRPERSAGSATPA